MAYINKEKHPCSICRERQLFNMEIGKVEYINKCCNCCFKPKEKQMEKQKFQFESEEQAREIIELLACRRTGCEKEDDECTQCDIDKLKRNGYIRKSELQTLVDEAEEMYLNEWSTRFDRCHKNLYETIQALKKSHPEFKS